MNDPRVLLLCYGNPGRLDDGIGAAFAKAIEAALPANVEVESDYLLSIEDAASISEHDVVIFVDASVSGREPFSFEVLQGSDNIPFSTHALRPEEVIGLAERLFGAEAQGYALGIRGYEFGGFGEVLSPGARRNLEEAIEFVSDLLSSQGFTDVLDTRIH